jgi:hypothetical protein
MKKIFKLPTIDQKKEFFNFSLNRNITPWTSLHIFPILFHTKTNHLKESTLALTTQVLGSQPKQRHGKVRTESATRKSHLHSWKCEGMNSHTPKLTPTLWIGIPMESQIFKEGFQGSKFIELKSSLYHWKYIKT